MIERIWLDWSAPCLPAAAEWLIGRSATTGRLCTLDHVLCVLPGRRAGRLLIAELLRQCEANGRHLVPPRTATPGAMVDMIVPSDAPIATEAESVLAWTRALQGSDPAAIEPLVPMPPPADDFEAWRGLAQMIHTLHAELAGQRLDFPAVTDQAERLELLREGDRWRALAAVREGYQRILDSAGLVDPHEARDAARAASEVRNSRAATPPRSTGAQEGWKSQGLQTPPSRSDAAIESNVCGLDDTLGAGHLVLIGVVELNRTQQDAAALVPCVTALVHAPEAMCAMFDEFGCVLPRAWEHRVIELDSSRIIVADRPEDQGEAVVYALGEFAGRFGADEVTIGFTGSEMEEAIAHASEWAELPLHLADGVPLMRTGPYRLLAQIAAWLDGPCFSTFAALLRHPHLEDWLHDRLESTLGNGTIESGVRNWLTLLDRYFSEHLHERFTGAWLSNGKHRQELAIVYEAVHSLLAPLSGKEHRPLGEWGRPALEILREVYGREGHDNLDETTEEACVLLRDALAAQEVIEPVLQLQCSAALALRLALDAASRERIAPPVREGQVEALGWLELHLDPAPALILAGVNDGALPQAVTGDAFLPDQLRAKLGLACNANRYARDAYLLEAIAHSRTEVTLITGRRAPDGEPLTPSRLLLACEREELPNRILRLCDEKMARRWPLPIGAPVPAETCSFVIPPPPDDPVAIERMSVTSFRIYLQCPYRFWLSRVQGLEGTEDGAEELDAARFGDIAHQVLNAFGLDPSIRDSNDADAISRWLRAEVDRYALAHYGDSMLPAVHIQLDRLKHRLDGFARCQADFVNEGWRLVQGEYTLPESAHLDVSTGGPMRITGRIDRIDWNERLDRWRIIDYKTGDAAKTPFETHHGAKKYREGWIDLQLPLYRHLATQAGFEGGIEVGYINLPKDPDAVAFCAAEWNDEQIDEAIDLARQVVIDIREGTFSLNRNFDGFDDFENICQTKVLGGDAGAMNGEPENGAGDAR